MTRDDIIQNIQRHAGDPQRLREYIDSFLQTYARRPTGAHTAMPTGSIPGLPIIPASDGAQIDSSIAISSLLPRGGFQAVPSSRQQPQVENHTRYQELPQTLPPNNPFVSRTPNHLGPTYNPSIADSGIFMNQTFFHDANEDTGSSVTDLHSARSGASINDEWISANTRPNSQLGLRGSQFAIGPAMAGTTGLQSTLDYFGSFGNVNLGTQGFGIHTSHQPQYQSPREVAPNPLSLSNQVVHTADPTILPNAMQGQPASNHDGRFQENDMIKPTGQGAYEFK